MLLEVSLAREINTGVAAPMAGGMCRGGLLDGTWHQPAWHRVPTHEGMWAKQVASQSQPPSPQLEAGAEPEAPAPQHRQEQG